MWLPGSHSMAPGGQCKSSRQKFQTRATHAQNRLFQHHRPLSVIRFGTDSSDSHGPRAPYPSGLTENQPNFGPLRLYAIVRAIRVGASMNFFAELKRGHIYRMAAAYAVVVTLRSG